jgi:hypothetical protein
MMMLRTSCSEPASPGNMKSLKRRRVSSIITVAKTLTDKERTTLSLPLLSVYLLLGSFIAALGKVVTLLVSCSVCKTNSARSPCSYCFNLPPTTERDFASNVASAICSASETSHAAC